MNAGFRILEHPSDLGIEARGSSLPETFAAAATGLMSVILDLSTVIPTAEKEIMVKAGDIEQLLVKWLSEILYLYDGGNFVCKEFEIQSLQPNLLCAVVRGTEFSNVKHRTKLDIKAITYHQLVVEEKNDGCLVRVFVDV